ncbi:hypothetical protein JCM10207_006049 [Rhodosporidiobolus poonsookiae]
MGKKPPLTVPTPKHTVPVSSPISTLPTVPPRERNVQVRQLTTPVSRAPAPRPQQVAKKRRKKKQKKEDVEPTDGRPIVGRIIRPASETGPKQHVVGKRRSGTQGQSSGAGRTGRSAEPAGASSSKARPAMPSQQQAYRAAQQEDDPFVSVTGEGGEITFSRPRSDVLNASISSILGHRPSDILEQHDREVRTKRQKLFAEEFKKELLMDVDVADDEAEKGSGAKGGGDEWVDMDDDDELLVTPVASDATEPPVDLFGTSQAKAPFPSAKPFTFPAQPSGGPPPTTFDFSFALPPSILATGSVAESDAAHTAISSDALKPAPPLEPFKPASSAEAASFDTLPKALPLPAGALPKPTLRSAAAVLAGKKRKPKKLNRAPQLFDYLSDEEEDDWEDVGQSTEPPRPKDGRAVEGKLPPPVLPEDADKLAELEAEAKERQKKADRDILPETRAHAEKLVPRVYQSSLLERAKVGNCLTVMPTGSGKTLIAVLLIDWIHEEVEKKRQAAGQPKRMQFFLTQSVPLVHQQAEILAHNTPLRVGKLFGSLKVNLCSPAEWAYNFEHFDVLVLTAQLLLDSLAHGMIKMEQISLLCFDEAHHAKSNHPFAAILRDFYHRTPVEKRPRILGLTASPLDSNQGGLEEARKLEALFDAKLITAPPETREELAKMVARPTILRIDYDPALPYPRTELYQNVLDKVVVQDDLFKRYLDSADAILALYGPDASDLVWHLALERYKAKFLPVALTAKAEELLEEKLAAAKAADEQAMQGVEGGQPEGEMVQKRRELSRKEKNRMREELQKKLENDINLDLPDWMKVVEAHEATLSYERLSPKLRKLIDVLKVHASAPDRFCGIVFVNRRIDAYIIAEILKQLQETTPELGWIRVGCVTGHGLGSASNLGPRMPWREQASVLTAFGEGDTNLLVATSVVEEGLDVQPCNFVCRFDLYSTHIAYIQSRGRARATGSHYVLFVEKDNLEEKRKLLKIAQFDLAMTEFLDRGFEQDADPEDFFGAADEKLEYLEEPSTGAVLTPHFALSLLGRYCMSLPKSDEFSIRAPQFAFSEPITNEFGETALSCSIALPSSSKIRLVTGPLASSSKLAKRAAAFTACKILRNAGVLDEHFLPLRTFPPDEVLDAAGNVVGSKKQQIEYEKALSKVFIPTGPCGKTTTFYATLLHFGGQDGTATITGAYKSRLYRPVVLLTRKSLPPTPPTTLFLEGEPVKVFATSAGAIPVTTEQRDILTRYSKETWRAVLNKEMRIADDEETKKPLELIYFIAELRPDAQIAAGGLTVGDLKWARMDEAARNKEVKLDWRNLDSDALEDSIIVDEAKNGCRYFFEGVRFDLDPYCELPPGRQSDKGPHIKTVMDYYLSFNDRFFHSVNVAKDQPLLEISRMSKAITFLSRTPRNDVSANTKKLRAHLPRFALSQTCLKHFLPASVYRTVYLLPSILTDLDQRLLVLEFNQKVFGNLIDPEQLHTALMTPSAGGAGDYNRLELLGDAFLKLVISVQVFVSHERTTHEGDLHRARLAIVCNRNLFEKGVAVGLPAYLVSRPFTSRQFLPPNFELLKGQPPPTSSVIGGKTIADGVEASIGAAIETGYAQPGTLNAAFDLALIATKAFDIELGGVKVWDDFARKWGSPGPVVQVEGEYLAVEEALGYTFKHGNLVVEAFTHPSKLDMVSFERCEWLGDSVLDYYVVRYAWNRWNDLSEGHLTEMKGGCVSNETLAALAVELNLDRFLIYEHDQLEINIRLYRERIVQAKEKEHREAREEQRQLQPYWLCLDPPKAVADIVESLFGALFLDSGFDPVAAQNAFDTMLVPFLSTYVTPTSLKVDAIRTLLEMAQSFSCDDVSHVSSTLDSRVDPATGELIPRLTRCSVVAHNYVLATTESANAKNAKKIASSNALTYLRQNTGFFAHACDCSTRREIAREAAEEHQQRLRDEGLLSEPDSDDEEEEREVVPADGGGGGAGEGMEVDA